MLCAGYNDLGPGTCISDSGGPLVCSCEGDGMWHLAVSSSLESVAHLILLGCTQKLVLSYLGLTVKYLLNKKTIFVPKTLYLKHCESKLKFMFEFMSFSFKSLNGLAIDWR